ncbi:hypothetical protein GNF51_16835, partial [Clostridium perfringens]|uniref:hypothetical protein n=1 Tax=Clostridium perfringens TaxID=1502 RepID=UPI002AC58EA5
MKKYILLLCSMFLIVSQLVSCASIGKSLNEKNKSINKIFIFASAETIGKKLNDTPILVINDTDGIKLFSNLIDNAVKIDGILDMATPKYIAEISYSDIQ